MDVLLKRLRLVEQITEKINRGQQFDDIFEILTTQLKGLIPCDRLAVGFMHSDGQTLVVGPVHGRAPVLLGTGYKESVAGTSLLTLMEQGRTRIINDLPAYSAQHARSLSTKLIVKEGLKSSLTVPLIVGGKSIGVMWFSSRKAGAYLADHESFMRLIAGHLAIILEKGRLQSRITADRYLKRRLNDENVQLREAIASPPAIPDLIGESLPWRKMLRTIERVAASESTVLIRGETGTGKELIARAIHRLSNRSGKPFIALNCGALSPALIASELFGHERGAFTGAAQRKLGRLDLAQHGTLFLDEVGELPPDMQVKLLRVLQEREFERVGGTQTLKVDVRIIAATHRNLEKERIDGRFRDDLFFRLNVFPIIVPPLRERKEDIEPLLAHFLKIHSQKANRSFERIGANALESCHLYHWPGNVRELENLVERNVILCAGPVFDLDPMLESDSQLAAAPANRTLDAVVKAHLAEILKATRGRIYGKNGAAQVLGLKPSTLQAKLRKYGLNRLQPE